MSWEPSVSGAGVGAEHGALVDKLDATYSSLGGQWTVMSWNTQGPGVSEPGLPTSGASHGASLRQGPHTSGGKTSFCSCFDFYSNLPRTVL